MKKYLFVLCVLTFLPFSVYPNNIDKQETISLIKQISREYGVDYRLIYCVIKVESNFNPYAISHKGAQGLMQIMPGTQKELGITQPFSKYQNIKGGVVYLVKQIRRFGVRKGLWAYNAGPSRVLKKQVPNTTKLYANNIIRHYWRLYARG